MISNSSMLKKKNYKLLLHASKSKMENMHASFLHSSDYIMSKIFLIKENDILAFLHDTIQEIMSHTTPHIYICFHFLMLHLLEIKGENTI